MERTYGKLIQFRIRFWHEIDEARIQAAGSYRFQLVQTRRRIKLHMLSQCWSCGAHGCNCGAKNQL
jgi:hypothetical protein